MTATEGDELRPPSSFIFKSAFPRVSWLLDRSGALSAIRYGDLAKSFRIEQQFTEKL